jgi:MoxR-like ATPase
MNLAYTKPPVNISNGFTYIQNMTTITIDVQGVPIRLSPEVQGKVEWIAQLEPFRQLRACWKILGPGDWPMIPRLLGPPGLGKTTLALAVAQSFERPVYLMQCTSDTRPEDLVINPVLGQDGKIHYHASPLLSAVLTGGIAILDEANRMPEKSWASLAGLLDHRRTIESIIAGFAVKAHPEFRCCVTMNEDASTYEVPEYILSRIQPAIELPFPGRDEELAILKYSVPDSSEEILQYCVSYLQQAHQLDLPFSIRDGININRYALRLMDANSSLGIPQAFTQAVGQVLGGNAFDLESLALERKQQFGETPRMDSQDFFFDEDEEDLNPGNGKP